MVLGVADELGPGRSEGLTRAINAEARLLTELELSEVGILMNEERRMMSVVWIHPLFTLARIERKPRKRKVAARVNRGGGINMSPAPVSRRRRRLGRLVPPW